MTGKKFICLCHDLTEADVIKAVEDGYDDLETLKRYIGVTMGPCQGKTCMMHIIRILSQRGKMKTPKTTRMRPPVDPIHFNLVAVGAKLEG